MIISRTPMRVSFFGGGTDYPVWYRQHGGAVLATTIDNLRQISDNLRDLTEDAKRYPSGVIFGAPPRPLERTP